MLRKNGDQFIETDCSIRPEFRAFATARLQELLGSKRNAEAVLDVLIWG